MGAIHRLVTKALAGKWVGTFRRVWMVSTGGPFNVNE